MKTEISHVNLFQCGGCGLALRLLNCVVNEASLHLVYMDCFFLQPFPSNLSVEIKLRSNIHVYYIFADPLPCYHFCFLW